MLSGPGLPKRINEALCVAAREPLKATAWLPFLLLGLGMLVGGVLAWGVAATRVVLPYDEAFLGLDRVSLTLVNAQLLAFMAHDRVTLAGTMLSIGVLYAGLRWLGRPIPRALGVACGRRVGRCWFRQLLLVPGFRLFRSAARGRVGAAPGPVPARTP